MDMKFTHPGETQAGENQKTLEEALECPICQDLFRDACETTCGHAFCEYCINKWLEKKHTCPVCNKNPSPVHPSWTLRLVTNCFQQATGEKKEGLTSSQEKQLGNECYKEGNYAQAIQHYTNAVKLASAPDFTLFNNRAQCYIKLGEFRRALDDCDQAIRLNNNIKAHIRKSKCLEGLGDFTGALQSLQTARQLDRRGEYKAEIDPSLDRLSRIFNSASSSSSSSSSTSGFHSGPNVRQPPPQPQQQQQQQHRPPRFPFQFNPQSGGGYPGAGAGPGVREDGTECIIS